jgi:hypothetical protein
MYIFNRTRVARSERFTDAAAWAVDIAGKASAVSGLQVGAWTSVMGPGAGTISWTTLVDSLADFEVATDKLIVDAGYNAAVATGDDLFTAGTDDGMLSVLTDISPDGQEINYVAIVQATAAVGQVAAAVEHGLALAAAASAVGGLTTWFGTSVTGAYGGVEWVTGAPTLAALEGMMNAVNSDPKFIALVDAGGHTYAPGATQSIFRRLA